MGQDLTGPTAVHRVTAPEPPPRVVDTQFGGRFEFKGGFATDATIEISTTSSTFSGAARCSCGT